MKKYLLIPLVLILLSSFVLSSTSTVNTDYYFDSTNYIAGGINTSDCGINGNCSVGNLDNLVSGGWTTSTGTEQPRYSNTYSTIGSSLSVRYEDCTDCVTVGYDLSTAGANNASFTGICSFKFLGKSTGGRRWVKLRFIDTDGTIAQLARDLEDDNNWRPDVTAGVCNQTQTAQTDATWQELTWNWTGTDVTTYVNGSPCATYANMNGLDRFEVYGAGVNPGYDYIDDFWCASGNSRPLGATLPTVIKLTGINVTSFNPPIGVNDSTIPFEVNGTDRTPTVRATTDETSNCSLNGAAMNGNGTATHLGTITTPLNIGVTYVPLNCTLSTNSSVKNSTNILFNITYALDTGIGYANESEAQALDLTFDINVNNSFFTNATLNWNGTEYTPTKTSNTTTTLFTVTIPAFLIPGTLNTTYQFFWNYSYNYTGTPKTFSSTSLTNQTVFRMLLDNCSTYTIRTLNISTIDESTDGEVYSLLGGYVKTWIDSESIFRGFNITSKKNTTHDFCISPDWTAYTAYLQLEYSNASYATKYYYFEELELSNTTQQKTLYLTNGTTAVTFTVVDENDNLVEDVYIQILSYDFITDTYKITEVIKTDDVGAAIGQIVLNTQWYKFILIKDGVVELETDPKKLTLTTYNFRINLQTDYLENYYIAQGVACTLVFDNSTLKYTYTFADASTTIEQGCLDIYRITNSGTALINSSCVESTSGEINIIIPAPGSDTFRGVGSIYIEGAEFMCADPLQQDFDLGWKDWGMEGVFVAMLLMVTIIMIGIWHPIIAIGLTALTMALLSFIGMIHLGWAALISMIILAAIAMWKIR